jgi:threonine dehydrogenase-like Zn-dependent dehydrogenase
MADDPEATICPVAEARALWFTGLRQAALRPAFVPSLRPPDALLVRAVVSGISRGTEALVFQGLVPDSEGLRMRCPFQAGAFPFPVKYGYAMVGIVEDGPAERIGETVLCLHPHQTRFVVPCDAAFPVPPETTAQRAVLAPQMETALNALWDAAPRVGDRIAVIGGGVIGCLVAYLCAGMPGCSVILIDPDESRRQIAKALGIAFARPDETLKGNNDLVFHASGTANGLQTALSLAGFEASVIEMSWYGAALVQVPLGAAFHSQRLLLRSSQVGMVAPDRRTRWDRTRRLALALSLTADPRLDVLLDTPVLFEDLPEALPGILGQAGALCVRIIYPEN